MALVTIVVATYNRAAVLARVIRCARAQTLTDWTMIVVGDSCSDETEKRVAAFADPRIRMINLPQRFGEQAGPTSVGLALAESPHVAFLNHDDYWLPGHLEAGVAALQGSDADFYWSRAAFFTNRGPRADRAVFFEESPPGRSLEDVYDGSFRIAEPMSSWLMTIEAVRRVGPMRLASEADWEPIKDYVVRAWRAGCKLVCGNAITVLADRLQPIRAVKSDSQVRRYDLTADFAEEWVRAIERRDTRPLLDEIADGLLVAAGSEGSSRSPAIASGPALERSTGLDLFRLRGAARDLEPKVLGRSLRHRTGEARVTTQPSLEATIAAVRKGGHGS